MITKITAARTVTESGSACVIANGFDANLLDIVSGAPTGTLFLPAEHKLGARKRWIRFVSTPKGKLHLDQGAVQAVVERRASLLPAGVREVEGDFHSGTVVELTAPGGTAIARGVSNFSSSELARLVGHASSDFQEILGRTAPRKPSTGTTCSSSERRSAPFQGIDRPQVGKAPGELVLAGPIGFVEA